MTLKALAPHLIENQILRININKKAILAKN